MKNTKRTQQKIQILRNTLDELEKIYEKHGENTNMDRDDTESGRTKKKLEENKKVETRCIRLKEEK